MYTYDVRWERRGDLLHWTAAVYLRHGTSFPVGAEVRLDGVDEGGQMRQAVGLWIENALCGTGALPLGGSAEG